MNFESLKLEKFFPNRLENAQSIYGGANNESEAPNGGCTCDTPAGSKDTPIGEMTWTGDIQTYYFVK